MSQGKNFLCKEEFYGYRKVFLMLYFIYFDKQRRRVQKKLLKQNKHIH